MSEQLFQKIEQLNQLLQKSTNPRQKQMYEKLLSDAIAQLKTASPNNIAPEPTQNQKSTDLETVTSKSAKSSKQNDKPADIQSQVFARSQPQDKNQSSKSSKQNQSKQNKPADIQSQVFARNKPQDNTQSAKTSKQNNKPANIQSKVFARNKPQDNTQSAKSSKQNQSKQNKPADIQSKVFARNKPQDNTQSAKTSKQNNKPADIQSKVFARSQPQDNTKLAKDLKENVPSQTTANNSVKEVISEASNLTDVAVKDKENASLNNQKSEATKHKTKNKKYRNKASSKSKNKLKIASPKPAIFQAIGVIKGLIELNEDKLYITIDDNKYLLLYTPASKERSYQALVDEVKKDCNVIKKVLVYPKYRFDRKKGHFLFFQLVAVENTLNNHAVFNELKENEFQLSGFWQTFTDSSSNCVVIPRNYDSKIADKIKDIDKKLKLLYTPVFIPIHWDNPSVEPFKYSPSSTQEEQKSRYFVQLKALFSDDKFTVQKELKKASLKPPKYMTP